MQQLTSAYVYTDTVTRAKCK